MGKQKQIKKIRKIAKIMGIHEDDENKYVKYVLKNYKQANSIEKSKLSSGMDDIISGKVTPEMLENNQ